MTVTVVTGARGFIGTHLCRVLGATGWHVRRATHCAVDVRDREAGDQIDGDQIDGDQIDGDQIDGDRLDGESIVLDPNAKVGELAAQLENVEVVFHLAGIAHEQVARARPELLQNINVRWSRRLLEACDLAGVRSFIWLSSIKVLGDVSAVPLAVSAAYAPGDAYAASKVRAERTLLEYPARQTKLVIVRPPLVYGPDVKGNFLSLMAWLGRGWPVPLGRAAALRSLIGIDNLTNLLATLASRDPGAAIYHAADDRDITVAELVSVLMKQLGQPDRLWRVPAFWFRWAAAVAGKRAAYQRLFEPLRVDQQATRQALGWNPPYTIEAQLEQTAKWYRQRPL